MRAICKIIMVQPKAVYRGESFYIIFGSPAVNAIDKIV